MLKGNNTIEVTERLSIQDYSALTDNEHGRNDFAPRRDIIISVQRA